MMRKTLVTTAMVAVLAAACLGGRTSGAALPDPAIDSAPAKDEQSVVFAGGCFWGVQAVFQHVKGVRTATSGYAGGLAHDAHYETVSTGTTGHAESVKVVYDPAQISFGQLLKVFFAVAHNPTEVDRQGPDTGTQYRSEIFYTTNEQQKVAKSYIDQLDGARAFSKPIATTLEPLDAFFAAEDYHQNYAETHPDNMYIYLNDAPKIEKLKEQFPDLYK